MEPTFELINGCEMCDFPHSTPVAADDCHGGEVLFCEAHRPLMVAASRAGILDRPDYTIEDILRGSSGGQNDSGRTT